MSRPVYLYLTLVCLLFLSLAGCERAPSPTPTAASIASPSVSSTHTPRQDAAPATHTSTPPSLSPTPSASPVVTATEASDSASGLWTPGLRQALAAAIDREAIVDQVFAGRATPAYHILPLGYPFYSEPFLMEYGARDLDRASRLLIEAGYSDENPLTFDLAYPQEQYGSVIEEVVSLVQTQLEETGLIQVSLVSRPWEEYLEQAAAGAFPAFILGWYPEFADPHVWFDGLTGCEQSSQVGINYCSEANEALLEQAAGLQEAEARKDVYADLGEILTDEAPVIPLYWEPEFIVYREALEGISVDPNTTLNYSSLRFVDSDMASDTIIIGTTAWPNSLDPTRAVSLIEMEILKNIGLPLLRFENGAAELVPAAGQPVVSSSGEVYTFTLSANQRYPDGDAVTAGDYARAVERQFALDGVYAGIFERYIDSVAAPDERSLVIRLHGPYAFFPALAAAHPFIPQPSGQFPANATIEIPDTLSAGGPYQLVRYTPEEEIVLQAVEDYSGFSPPSVPNIIIRFYESAADLASAIENREVDIAWRTVGMLEAARLQAVDGLTARVVDTPALRLLVFNNTTSR